MGAADAGAAERAARRGRGAGAEQIHGGACCGGAEGGWGKNTGAAVGAGSAVRSAGVKRGQERGAGKFSGGPRGVDGGALASGRALQRNGYADYRAAAAAYAMAGTATSDGRRRKRSRVAGGSGGREWGANAHAFSFRRELRGAGSVLRALRDFCAAEPRRRIWAGVPGSDGVRKAGDRRRAWRSAGSD